VTRPQAPKLLSDITVGEEQPWEMSQPFATEGMLYLSYRFFGDVRPASRYDDTRRPTSDDPPEPGSDATRANRHFLVRVDYANPAEPEIDDTQVNLPGQLRGVGRAGHLLFTAGQDYDLTTGAAKPDSSALHVSAFDGNAAHLLDTLPLRSSYDPVAVVGETIFTLETQPAQIWYARPYDPIYYRLNPDTAAVAKAVAVDRIWWGGWWKPNDKNSVLATWRLDDAGKFVPLDSVETGHDSSLFVLGNLLVTSDYSRTLRLFDATNPAALNSLGTFSFDGWVTPDVAGADGSLETGLWVPVGRYGVEIIALPPEATP
jgi:hypothetical protein